MKRYMIEYLDWAHGEWYGMGAGPGYGAKDIWAESAEEAVEQAKAKFGNRGKAYRATEVTE